MHVSASKPKVEGCTEPHLRGGFGGASRVLAPATCEPYLRIKSPSLAGSRRFSCLFEMMHRPRSEQLSGFAKLALAFHHFASRACRNRVGAKAVSKGSRARPLRGSFPGEVRRFESWAGLVAHLCMRDLHFRDENL